ncbi:MAG: hypothetical protein ABI844_07220 [Saprospiraceae bacterium]
MKSNNNSLPFDSVSTLRKFKYITFKMELSFGYKLFGLISSRTDATIKLKNRYTEIYQNNCIGEFQYDEIVHNRLISNTKESYVNDVQNNLAVNLKMYPVPHSLICMTLNTIIWNFYGIEAPQLNIVNGKTITYFGGYEQYLIPNIAYNQYTINSFPAL